MNVISLNVENNMVTCFAKLVNILHFNPKKLNIQEKGNDEIGIHYIEYDKDTFYLVIDDLKVILKKK